MAVSTDIAELILPMIAGAIVGGIIGYIITVIPLWRIFTKAGEPGWKALIPLYSTYILYKISWKSSMFWVTLGLSIVGSILMWIVSDAVIILIIGWLLYVAALVLGIMLYYNLSKSFGHGAGFTIGLVFLCLIFLYILAFGKSEYKGAQG